MLKRFKLSGMRRCLLPAVAIALSLVQANAQDSAAQVIELVGRVSIERPSALNSSLRAEEWALFAGGVVKPQQVVVTGPDGYAKLQVADGSTFEVFPNSRVTFRGNRSDWKDLLDLWLGRVKVHIQKLNGQPNNNRVTTPTAVISVRGTIFDVQIEDLDDTTLVSLEEGIVDVYNKQQGGGVTLRPGESVRVFKNQPLAQRAIDRGKVVQGALRAAAQAIYDLLYRRQAGIPGGTAGSGGGTTTVGSGDHGGSTPTGGGDGSTTAPAPPPAAPPPPPPPPPQQ